MNMKIFYSSILFLCGISAFLFFQNCSKLSVLSDSNQTYVDLVTPMDPLKSGDGLTASSSSAAEPINFGFHTGGVTPENQVQIEEYLFPQKSPSPWYIAQWKKISPLLPSRDLKLNANGNLFEVTKPAVSESKLRSFLGANNQVVYELETNQGHGTSVGGSNVLISSNVQKLEMARFDREMVLSFDTKLLEKSAVVKSQYRAQESQLLAGEVLGFFIGGFPITFDDGNPDHLTSLFIQYAIADTRIKNPSQLFRYRGFYPHGNYMEIVATIPVSDLTGKTSDFKFSAAPSSAPLEKININLNKLLCVALQGEFNRTDGLSQEKKNFYHINGGMYVKNLSKWRVGSMYLGFESQAAFFDESKDSSLYFYPSNHPLYGAHDIRADVKSRISELYKGNTKLVAQIADLNLKAAADPYQPMNTCDEVLAAFPTDPQVNLIDTPICAANSVTTSGCTQPANGTSERTCNSVGSAYGACVQSCSAGYHQEGTACVKDAEAPISRCESGAFINTSTWQGTEWMCHCTAADPIFSRSGWRPVDDNCSHRVAEFFCNYGHKIYWVCDLKNPPNEGSWNQEKINPNCYHWDSGVRCSN